MDIFLHIGMPKTGTTSLQSFLSTNRVQLLQHNFLYPTSPAVHSPHRNHQKLAAFAMDPGRVDNFRKRLKIATRQKLLDFRARFTEDFEREMERAKAKKLILSSEHCSIQLTSKDEIEPLKEFLTRFSRNIKVIIYLRRQDDALLSSYSTEVKAGRTNKLCLPDEHETLKFYDYWHILQKWESVFGRKNILVKVFERNQFFENDLLKDFAQEIDLQLDKTFINQDYSNLSLDADCCEFLREFNRHVPRLGEDGISKMRGDIVPLLQQYSKSTRVGLQEEDLEKFMGSFETSNKKVAERYLERPNGKLFLSDFSTKNRVNLNEVEWDKDKTFEIFGYLWRQQQQEINAHKSSFGGRVNNKLKTIQGKVRLLKR